MGNRLQGKVAIVVGAGTFGDGWGNGKATAVTFAREGAKVFAVDVSENAVDETQSLIEKEGGICRKYVADVTQTDQIKNMADECINEFGRIDILHNNVGITAPGGPTKLSEETWERVFHINTQGTFLTCKFVIPHMIRAGGGSIINVSSIASIRYLGFSYAAYDASKAAVNTFTRSVAMEFATHGIRANVIHIGMMDTPLARQGISAAGRDITETFNRYAKKIPLGRMGTAWDSANAAAFLASDESSYITGVEIPVDGGLVCCTA